MKSLAKHYPRQVGYPQRKTVTNPTMFYRKINQYNGMKNIYYSVYDCEDNGVFVRPNLDKIVLDFDYGAHSLKILRESINKLDNNNIKFSIVFSGKKGFHLYVFTDNTGYSSNPKDVLYNAQIYVINLLGIDKSEVDYTVLSDITQLIRVPNTVHLKSNLFAIPLHKEDMQLNFTQIKNKAKAVNGKLYIFNTGLLNIKQFDYQQPKREVQMGNLNFTINSTDNLVNKLHPCVKLWLLYPKEYCKNYSRWFFACYMRDIGLLDYADQLAKKFWQNIPDSSGRSNKYKEFKQEKQLYYTEKKPDQVVPNCETLFELGFCPGKCSYYRRKTFPLYRQII